MWIAADAAPILQSGRKPTDLASSLANPRDGDLKEFLNSSSKLRVEKKAPPDRTIYIYIQMLLQVMPWHNRMIPQTNWPIQMLLHGDAVA